MFLLDFLVLIIFPGDPLLHSSLVIPSLKKRQQPLLSESNILFHLPSLKTGERGTTNISGSSTKTKFTGHQVKGMCVVKVKE